MTTLLTLYTGQEPLDPLALPITKEDGSVGNVDSYDAAEVLFLSPDGDVITEGSAGRQSPNIVYYNWEQGPTFTAPGLYEVQVKLTTVGGVVDYSSVGFINVLPSLEYAQLEAFVTAEEVYNRTFTAVGVDDIFKAQSVIEDELAMDLADIEDLSDDDTRILKNAIVRQTVYLKEHPEALSGLSGVSSATANGVSVTYAPGASGSFLAPLAKKALAQLSWRRSGFRTLVPAGPYTESYEPTWEHLWSEEL